jgi:hypothetical protein
MFRFPFVTRLAILPLVLVIAGCGGKSSQGILAGKVIYNGQAVNGGAIALHPAGEHEKVAKGGKGEAILIPLNQEGMFRSGDVPLGEYKVVVQPSKGTASQPPKELAEKMKAEDKARWEAKQKPETIKIPEKYTKLGPGNDLTISVKEGETTVTLELKD